MANNYKVKADYSLLRNKHQVTSGGNIYEHDIMTIAPMDGLFAEGEVLYADSNFRFSVNNASNMQKRHSRGQLTLPENGASAWTMENLPLSESLSDESTITIKPNYNSLKDFAYYGSALKLIEGTINGILLDFPGELFFSRKTLLDYNFDEWVDTQWASSLVLPNDFELDMELVCTDGVPKSGNPLRYLSYSIGDYVLIDTNGNEVEGAVSITITNNQVDCEDKSKGVISTTVTFGTPKGSTVVSVLVKGDEKYYLHDGALKGYSIRPKSSIVENYFDSLDDFTNVLLNRTTKPIYKAVFDTPFSTDYGLKYKKEAYTLPSINNYNPDIKSGAYLSYLGNLISLAEFHDEYDSDNIWRSMTHEAIKNLDWTYSKNSQDVETIDSSKIYAMLQLYGRQFDTLKRYIDNIKWANAVTYDEKNNTPDYCLSDITELEGWEVKTLFPRISEDERTSSLYPSKMMGYTPSEANLFFERVLKINSGYLKSLKGTRKGIETMLGILGLDSTMYEIEEEIYCVTSVEKGCDFDGVSDFPEGSGGASFPSARNIGVINTQRESYAFDSGDELYGIPFKAVKYGNGAYVVPWYDPKEKYNGNFYFQCMGGWEKHSNGEINTDLTNKTTFTNAIYGETQTYLRFVKSLKDLVSVSRDDVKSGETCYVLDISKITEMYNGDKSVINSELNEGKVSHYFRLHNPNLCNVLGVSDSEFITDENKNGWIYVSNSDIYNVTGDGLEVVRLESIIEDSKGNNPHVGYGQYDDGKTYFDYYKTVFRYSELNKSGDLVNFSDADKAEILKYKFNLNKIVDNKKCWYFTDNSVVSKINENTPILLGFTAMNPINGQNNDVRVADSVINSKCLKLTIKMCDAWDDNEKAEYIKYVNDVIMFYVKQMIPSTTIFEYSIIEVNCETGTPTPQEKVTYATIEDETTSFRQLSKVDGIIYFENDRTDGSLDSIDETNIIK